MRTEANLSALVAALVSNCGDMYEACRCVGLSLLFVQNWRKDDQKVDTELMSAEQAGYMQIESVAMKRAMHGHEEPVFYQGEEIGSRTVHHDGLLTKIMEARIPAYKKGVDGQNTTFNGPTQINIMPRANSYGEWLEMKTSTLAKRVPSLPAPMNDDIIDVECVPVDENPLASIVL